MRLRHLGATKTFGLICLLLVGLFVTSCTSTQLITGNASLEKCEDISQIEGVKLTSGEIIKFENKEGRDSLVLINKDGLIYKDPMGKKIKIDKEDIAGGISAEV